MLNIYNQHVDNKDLQFNLMEEPSLERSLSISQTQVSPDSDTEWLIVNEPDPFGPVAVADEWRYYIHRYTVILYLWLL